MASTISPARPGFVYFARIGESDRVKIGFASDPRARVRNMQTSAPEPINLVRVLLGTPADERRLHTLFRPHWLAGEWFALSAEMIESDVGLTDVTKRFQKASVRPSVSASTGSHADDQLVRMWLHNRPQTTVRAYTADVRSLLTHSSKPIVELSLSDLQAWDATAVALSAATRSRRLAAAKSLLKFAHETGVIDRNPAVALRVTRPVGAIAERVLSETDVQRMIGSARDDRSRLALRFLYLTGVRASEACGLCWRDVIDRKKGSSEITVLGKGRKLRTIAIPAALRRELGEMTANPRPDSPLLPGRSGEALHPRALHRLVKRAARRAGLGAAASPHWLRHACASHALDRGAPVHVVQQQLGHASLDTTTRYLHTRRGASAADYLPDTT